MANFSKEDVLVVGRTIKEHLLEQASTVSINALVEVVSKKLQMDAQRAESLVNFTIPILIRNLLGQAKELDAKPEKQKELTFEQHVKEIENHMIHISNIHNSKMEQARKLQTAYKKLKG